MPLSTALNIDMSPDKSGRQFEPVRDVNGEAMRAVAVFPAGDVGVVWYDPEGKTGAPVPVPGRHRQREMHGLVYAPGISPLAIVSVEFGRVDMVSNGYALTFVTYQLYLANEHVAKTEDEKVRLRMIALARQAYPIFPSEMAARDPARERDLADRLFDTVQENNIREHVAVRLLAAAYALRRGQQGLDDAGQLVRDMIRRIEDSADAALGVAPRDASQYTAGARALRAWLTEALPSAPTVMHPEDEAPF